MHLCAVIVISIALWSVPSSGLRCWTCANARSPAECRRNGRFQQCRFIETVCQTEVRYSAGWGNHPLIKSACKEPHACNNNQIQNPRKAWVPTQCNSRKKNSVCRCCCSGNLCNMRNLLCETRVEMEKSMPSPRRDLPAQLTSSGCQVGPEVPERGRLSCTNGWLLESKCTFACVEGYELVGSEIAICRQYPRRTMWNRRSPICRKATPKRSCGPVAAPKYGGVNCFGSGKVGATNCIFYCYNGLKLKGAQRTSCIGTPDGPRWSDSTPTCVSERCAEVRSPANGYVRCRGSGDVGTTCYFLCNFGLEVEGDAMTSCILTTDGPKWTNDAPTCSGRCRRAETPENGFVDCVGNGEVGTVCTFTCRKGLKMIGASAISCDPSPRGGFWSDAAPTCVGRCAQVQSPANGFVECYGSGEIGTTCAFDCARGFEMKGDATIHCEMRRWGPRWTGDVPVCAAPVPPPTCSNLGQLRHGNITCTNEHNSVGTMCSFQCSTQGYELLPSNRLQTVCQSTSDGKARWSKKKPCCNANCPPMAKKDIVVIVDSSGSIKEEEWTRMIDFLIRIVRTFHISRDSVQISAFRFNRDVDKETQILFGDYETVDELTDAISKIKKMGSGTNIGRALRHAQNVSLATRNRPDVTDMVFIMTDGKSNDTFAQTAKELRDTGVQIVALGVFRKKSGELMEHLVEMTGDPDLVLEASDVLNSFHDRLLKSITDKICEVSCE